MRIVAPRKLQRPHRVWRVDCRKLKTRRKFRLIGQSAVCLLKTMTGVQKGVHSTILGTVWWNQQCYPCLQLFTEINVWKQFERCRVSKELRKRLLSSISQSVDVIRKAVNQGKANSVGEVFQSSTMSQWIVPKFEKLSEFWAAFAGSKKSANSCVFTGKTINTIFSKLMLAKLGKL